MSYVIKSVRVEDKSLVTEVEYTFFDGSKKTMNVAHFYPSSKEEVIQGIQNREVSEQREIDAPALLVVVRAEISALIE